MEKNLHINSQTNEKCDELMDLFNQPKTWHIEKRLYLWSFITATISLFVFGYFINHYIL